MQIIEDRPRFLQKTQRTRKKRGLSPIILVAYELGESTQLTLEELKEKVKAAVRKNGNRWTSTGYTLRELQERVNAAKDFLGVVQALII